VFDHCVPDAAECGVDRGPLFALLDELCFAYATLETALQLAAMRAARAGRETVAAEDLLAGITEAADLAQTAGDGALEGFLRTLTGGLDAARSFAHASSGA